MKFRSDFVTNSSSSSFIACGIKSKALVEFLDDASPYGCSTDYGSTKLGIMVVEDDIMSMKCLLDYGDFHIRRLQDDQVRTAKQAAEDDAKANAVEHILASLLVFFPDLTDEERQKVEALVAEAVKAGHTKARVYFDLTDELDPHEFRPEDFDNA